MSKQSKEHDKELEELEREREKLEAERDRLEAARDELEAAKDRMEEEKERLEEERERMLEEERERIEEEREMAEEEAEEADEEMKGARECCEDRHRVRHRHHDHRRVHIQRKDLTPEQQEKLDQLNEKLEKAQVKIEIAMDGLNEKIENTIAGLDLDRINRTVAEAMEGVDIDVCCDGKHQRYTKNLGVLNLKDITEEDLDKMGEIRNSGVVIVPEGLVSKVAARIAKNTGTIVPYKAGWRIFSGHTIIDKSMLEALDQPMEFIQTGLLEIASDVIADQIKEKIKSFHNYGHVSATEATYGALMSRCLENYGQISKNGHRPPPPDPPEPPEPPRPGK